MFKFFDIIANPLGDILNFIYYNLAFKSYGIAIILFTILIRLLLLPLMIKQYKSMARMQEVNPLIQDIQKRYKNDKEKLNQELMKVYQEHQVNPAAGCLPLLVQLPIFLALWQVITKPLTYMVDLGAKVEPLGKVIDAKSVPNYPEISIINNFVGDKVGSILTPDMIDIISQMKSGFHFLSFGGFEGLNLGLIPTFDFGKYANLPVSQYLLLLLLPLIAVGTTFLSSKLSMPKTSQGAGNPMQSSMLFVAPLMTLIFSFQFPAGMSLYWIVGNIVQIFQQIYINKVVKKKEVPSK